MTVSAQLCVLCAFLRELGGEKCLSALCASFSALFAVKNETTPFTAALSNPF
jgi:hypothetical protein